MSRWLRTLSLVFPLAHFASGLQAQPWPAKPIHIVVPFAPGGPADLLPRLIGPNGNLVVNPHIYANLPYDVFRDFAVAGGHL